ncbi:MAG: hypothetical protein ACRYGR_05220 [Janthinobacterium lividum]
MIKILKLAMIIAIGTNLGFVTSLKSSEISASNELKENEDLKSCFLIPNINLSNKNLKDKDLKDLSDNPNITNVTLLNLFYNPLLTPEGIKELNKLRNLTHLNLGGNEMGDNLIEVLSGEDCTYRLKSLDLGRNNLTATGINKLVASNHSSYLVDLRLYENNLKDEDIQLLTFLTNLEILDLSANDMGDEGLSQIAQNLTNLNELYLRGNNKIYDHMPLIQLPKLTKLYFAGNSLNDESREELYNHSQITTLELEVDYS